MHQAWADLAERLAAIRFPVWQRWPLLKRSRKKDCLHVRPKLGSDLKCEHAAGRKSGNLSAKCAGLAACARLNWYGTHGPKSPRMRRRKNFRSIATSMD